MDLQYIFWTLTSCAFFMGIVAWISYQKTKGEINSQDGYFLAGRGLTGVFIAGSMVLTNLSAEQMIGLNGSAYGYNMSSMAWEVTAAFATIVMALVFLPKYLSGAFSTLPEFLNDRFDPGVRRLTVVLFMVGYGLITIPSILYSGSIAILQLFDVPSLLRVDYSTALVITIITVGLIGSVYAVFGGLKAVAVSDTINGVGLLIIGIIVPLFGFAALGDGSILEGMRIITQNHPEKLNAIGAATDPTPFGTIFTGMIFANLFYWGTNQYVIQRTLGAANLAEGQKGVLLSGFFKLLVPFFMMIPGIIAFHLYGGDLATIDLAFPTLVKDVLPVYMSGFFLAVLLGVVFSSFNSLLNSAATLFVLDIYKPLKNEPLSDEKLINVAKVASVVIALFSFIVSPLLQYAPEGLFQVIRVFTGFYNIPVIAIVLIGLFTKRVPPLAAKVTIIFHVIVYALLQFVIKVDINFIHIYAILFFTEIGLMLAIGYARPLDTPWHYHPHSKVDMTPWAYALPASVFLIVGMVSVYLLFSPLGLVGGTTTTFWILLSGVIALGASFAALSLRRWRRKYGQSLHWNEE
ncbi:MAG: hypothetical protein RL336_196 [Pseudomonadota bacterium]|jgi:SSS family solute:Na+ symporter